MRAMLIQKLVYNTAHRYLDRSYHHALSGVQSLEKLLFQSY